VRPKASGAGLVCRTEEELSVQLTVQISVCCVFS